MMRVLRTRWLLAAILLGVLVTPATSQPQCPEPQTLRAAVARLSVSAHPHLLHGPRHLPHPLHGGARHAVSVPGLERSVDGGRLRSLSDDAALARGQHDRAGRLGDAGLRLDAHGKALGRGVPRRLELAPALP